MWISILINIIFSILIIVIGHYLWDYFKDTYSEKVTKDILGSQTQKYKMIIEQLQEKKHAIPQNDPTDDDIKEDLEQFLQEMTQG